MWSSPGFLTDTCPSPGTSNWYPKKVTVVPGVAEIEASGRGIGTRASLESCAASCLACQTSIVARPKKYAYGRIEQTTTPRISSQFHGPSSREFIRNTPAGRSYTFTMRTHSAAQSYLYCRKKALHLTWILGVGEIVSRNFFLGHSFFTRVCKLKLCVFSGLCLAKRVRA